MFMVSTAVEQALVNMKIVIEVQGGTVLGLDFHSEYGTFRWYKPECGHFAKISSVSKMLFWLICHI